MPRQRKLKDPTAAERQRRHRERFAAELAELKAAAAAAKKEPTSVVPKPGASTVIAVEHMARWPLPTASWVAGKLGRGASMVFARSLIMEAEKLPPEPQPGR